MLQPATSPYHQTSCWVNRNYGGVAMMRRMEESRLPTSPVIIVHGGGWAIPDEMVEPHLRGVRAARAAGWKVLEAGGAALDAVEAAIVLMEDDDAFDAGRGSFLNSEGRVQLDALL